MTESRPDVGDRVPRAEAVVAAALRAFDQQEWPRLVELTDRDSLAALKESYIERKRVAAIQPPLLDDDALASDEIPEALKDWAMNRHAFGELAGITSIEQADALEPAEFMTRWAQARHPHYLVDGVRPWHSSEYLPRNVVIGSVAISPDTVAVLVRDTGTYSVSTLGDCSLIAVLGDNAGGWALNAANGWLGMADMYF